MFKPKNVVFIQNLFGEIAKKVGSFGFKGVDSIGNGSVYVTKSMKLRRDRWYTFMYGRHCDKALFKMSSRHN